MTDSAGSVTGSLIVEVDILRLQSLQGDVMQAVRAIGLVPGTIEKTHAYIDLLCAANRMTAALVESAGGCPGCEEGLRRIREGVAGE